MVTSRALTVKAYLDSLPDDRRKTVATVRSVIKKHLPKGYAESMQFGMISYCVPLTRKPDTYNGQPLGYVALASQKQHLSLYLMGLYGDPAVLKWFTAAWKKTGKKLDLGKSCLRFKSVEDLNLPLLGELISKTPVEAFIAQYEKVKRPR